MNLLYHHLWRCSYLICFITIYVYLVYEYYIAGYKEEGEAQCKPYNLSKLLYYIVKATPSKKRIIYANNINQDTEMWKDDDKLRDYGEETRRSIFDSVVEGASEGADIGGKIGSIFGSVGETIGRGIGSVVGGVIGFIGGLFS